MDQSAGVSSVALHSNSRSSPTLAQIVRSSAIYITVFLTYFFVGRIGLAVPFTTGNVSPVWPSAGVAVAAFLLFGNRIWPSILFAAFSVNFLTGIPAITAFAMAVGNTVGPFVGASLFLRRGFDSQIRRLQDFVALLACSVLVGTAISATVGVSALSMAGLRAWSGATTTWLIWWLGDAMGVLLVTPLLLRARTVVVTPYRGRLLEVALLAILTAISSIALFDDRIGFRLVEDLFAFSIFPFILWGAIRFQIAGAALTSCIIATVAVVETALGFGPFVRGGAALHNAAVLQGFIAIISLTGLTLAVIIQEKQEAQDALNRQTRRLVDTVSHRLQLAQQAADIGAWDWNLKTGEVVWSDELQLMHGFPVGGFDGRYETWVTTVHPDDLDWVKREGLTAIEQSRQYDVEYRSVRPDGSTYWTAARGRVLPDETGAPERMVGICMNIDQRKLAEQALRKSEKLAATGRLAATMAHEINNPLEAVTNLLYLARNAPEVPAEVRQYLSTADEELQRVGHIAKRTLAFYRDSGAPVTMELADTIDEVLGIFKRRIESKNILVTKDYAPGFTVVCNAGEIRQVLSNIILNAIDAVPQSGRVHIRVSPAIAGKNGVRVTVADSGSGITRDDMPRLFEPFFTTKKDVGTGLGLWISRTIVEKHKGSIRVKSCTTPGQSGTTVSIYLPHSAAASVSA